MRLRNSHILAGLICLYVLESVALAASGGGLYSDILKAYNAAFGLQRRKRYDEALAAYEGLIAKYPKSWHAREAHFRLAEVQVARGKPALAAQAYRDFLSKYPDDGRCPSVFLKIAEVHKRHTRDYAKAVQACRECLEKYPQSALAPQLILDIAYCSDRYLGKPKDAIKAREQFLARCPDDPRRVSVLLALAANHGALKDYDRAAETLRRAIAESSDHDEQTVQAYRALADSYARAGKTDAAAAALNEMMAKLPSEKLRGLDALANLCARSGKLTEAIGTYESLIALSPRSYRNLSYLNAMAGLYERQKKSKEALATLRRIVSGFPRELGTVVKALHQSAAIQMRESDYEGAIATYGELKKLPELEGQVSGERATLLIAKAMVKQGKVEDAIKVYTDYLARNPAEKGYVSSLRATASYAWEAHRELIRAYEAARDYESAVKVCEEIYQSNPRNELGRVAKAEVIRQRTLAKEPEKLIAAYEDYVATFPRDDKSRDHLWTLASYCAKRLHETKKAIAVYQRFRKACPPDDRARDALLQIASLHREAKEYSDAIAALEEYLALYPKHETVREAMKQLAETHLLNEERAEAEEVLQKLIRDFPLTPESHYAKLLLGRLPSDEGKE